MLVLLLALLGAGASSESTHSHHAVLDRDGKVVLYWTPRDVDIIFELHVETHGWVGLGFSPNGGMAGADIVVAWVTDAGEAIITDRHATDTSVPRLDESIDVTLEAGWENDTHTVVRFRRAWDTCDHQDMVLGTDTVRLIWAYHDQDPVHGHMIYHTLAWRGGRSIFLAEAPVPLISPDKPYQTWDILADNVLLPEDDHTHYWCKIYRAPPITKKHHMIGLEPVIQPGHESYVHHMVLYECHVPEDVAAAAGASTADWFEQHVNQPGESCYSPNMPAEWSFCLATNAWAWAVGSDGEVLPDHVGMPLGEEHGGATYFMLETHYDNPAMHTPVMDNSGIRIRYTDQLREFDTSMLLVGSEVNFLQMIPPGQEHFTSLGHCSADCTEVGFPPRGITILSGVLHSHLAGRKMRLRHLRNGKELPVILEDKHYDFNYQASRVPAQETVVLPGDELLVECIYNTSMRERPTFGGLSTKDEMCLVFVLYYPRSSLADCRSLPALKTVTNALGIQDIYGHSFEKLVEFMKDIGDAGSGAIGGKSAGKSTLSELLNILADETGYTLPALPERRSSAPLSEEDLLNLPFYTVAAPEPEVGPLVNYRTLLQDLLTRIRVKSPPILHNRTVGEVLMTKDWVKTGQQFNRDMILGQHNSLCLAHGRKPLIPYKPSPYPVFQPLQKKPNPACPEKVQLQRKETRYALIDIYSSAPRGLSTESVFNFVIAFYLVQIIFRM